MEYLTQFWEAARQALIDLLPLLATLAVSAVLLGLLHHLLLTRRQDLGAEGRLPRQLALLVLTGAAIVAAVVALPIGESTRGSLLGLVGVLLSATIALSSTTFISNAMAGVMLRSVGSFKPGDYVRVGDHAGRITERALFHTEIQTEDRDLTTLPNLYLLQNPIRVVRASGTIISAEVSLAYDIPRTRVDELLLAAARAAELTEPFVQVAELGDFSVRYRVAGFLGDVTTLVSTRSRLRRKMLDSLHDGGIEIVSPSFLNQRRIDGLQKVLPPRLRGDRPDPEEGQHPEAVMFDKADAAAHAEQLRGEIAAAHGDLAELEDLARQATPGGALERELERRRAAIVLQEALLERIRASASDD